MKSLIASLAVVLGISLCAVGLSAIRGCGLANADPILVDAGVGSGSGSAVTPVPAPAPTTPTIHDPGEDPAGFYGDMLIAKKKGWLAFVLVGLYGATRLIGYLGRNVSALAKLNSGKLAMVVATIGTVSLAGVDAVFLDGTLASVMLAMLFSLIGFLSAVPKKAA